MELLGLEPRSQASRARRIVLYPTIPIPGSGIAPLSTGYEPVILLLYDPGCTQSGSNRRYPECKSGAIPLRHECYASSGNRTHVANLEGLNSASVPYLLL